MQVSPGSRLGPYEIIAPLGAGGMGEVYRARDTRLSRDVAVKVLLQHLSTSDEIRSRFEREAKTVSGLNHPNICVLYDVGREGDTDYLVMELMEGETLATRLAQGALSMPEVLRIGSEIADALDCAHRAAVVHRDLKPGNIMLTKSGAKLMDFGLARATGLGGPASDSSATVAALSQSPTVAPLTAEGTIVGTFQYMSPEQLEGKETDKRTDVWALGCVLYEMCSGRRAFDGQSQASLISSIMGSEPTPISQLTPMAPPALDRLVAGCLAKNPADRLQSAHDIRLQLSWISEGGSQAGVPKRVAKQRRSRERLAWIVASVAIMAAAVATFFALRPTPDPPPVQAFLEPPPGVLFSSSVDKPLPLAISPDGTMVAFCARTGEGPDVLWVRSLGLDDARPLDGTEGAQGPFFSADGRSLGFIADAKLKRIAVTGGPVITLVDNVDPRGATWNSDDVILFTKSSFGPVSRVAADGGPLTAATVLDTTLGEVTHRYPFFLPDGRRFLYLARRGGAGAGESPKIYVGELGSSERTAVLDVACNVAYASGHLIYVRGTILAAQRFDPGSLKVTGPAVPLVDDARMDERFSRGVFAASSNGVLICMTGNNLGRTQLRWLDRTGQSLGDVGEPADYTYGGTPHISPDGSSAVIPIANRDRGVSDVWMVDLESGRRRKLTVDTKDHPGAQWLPDGKSVAVMTQTRTLRALDVITTDGTQSRRILDGQNSGVWPRSARGDLLLYESGVEGTTTNIYVIPTSGKEDPQRFAASETSTWGPQFSPDGRLIAYVSEETGRPEVFVAVYPEPGGRWQVSQRGGSQPRWSGDGSELFYRDPENFIVSVSIDETTSGFQTGAETRLFQFHGAGLSWCYDVAPDGERFLVTTPLEADLASPVTLITDWTRKMGSR
jgi:serine/threonine protein kinase